MASQPTLADLVHDGKRVAAVIQATKTGFLFTFDRETGAPVFPIQQKPVPQDAVPGEQPSRTQPFPASPPALTRQSPVTPEDAWGVAWFDTRGCRQRIEAYRSEGIFQPPSLPDSIMQRGVMAKRKRSVRPSAPSLPGSSFLTRIGLKPDRFTVGEYPFTIPWNKDQFFSDRADARALGAALLLAWRQRVEYWQTEHFQIVKDFMNAPQRFYRHLIDESESDVG